jgi:hypothetical protein
MFLFMLSIFFMALSLEMNLALELDLFAFIIIRLFTKDIRRMSRAFLVAGLNPFFDKEYVIPCNIRVFAFASDSEIPAYSKQVLHSCLVFLR